MYAGVDIGGTKTLVASIDDHGAITEKIRFETPKKYDFFIHELRFAAHKLGHDDYEAAGVGFPATIMDHEHGIGITFGNLPWKKAHILEDVEKVFHCPTVAENDAKMAALSEAMLIKSKYSRVLYITVSTGIGIGWVVDQQIDDSVGDGGGRAFLLEHHGKYTPWEQFASGRAIVARYGKRAEEIHDVHTWKLICRDLAVGLLDLIALLQPEVIVFGGSVGTYFDRYGKLLKAELKKYETPHLLIPVLRQAARPEEAVLFGCYDLARQTFKREIHANAR
jgi:predicted NBD/HSP70 family sugar kinase